MPHVITQITQAVKNTERVNIYLDGNFWIGLGKNDVITLRLFKGKELTDEEKLIVEQTSSKAKLLERAIAYIELRPRSCQEVRDYLVFKRKTSKEEAEKFVTTLQEKGLLSDEKFAQWYAEYKLGTNARGINRIKTDLMQKGVSKQIIANTLEKFTSNEEFQNDQTRKLEEYAQKVLPTIKAKDSYEFKSKLVQKLMSRGFPFSDIKVILKSLLEKYPSHTPSERP